MFVMKQITVAMGKAVKLHANDECLNEIERKTANNLKEGTPFKALQEMVSLYK